MNAYALRSCAFALGVVICTPAALAQTAAMEGDWILDTRLRYESVSQDGLEDADAVTLRARLGYETPAWRGFRALAELEGVVQLTDDFNDTVNGHTAYAVVPDPEAFELNRLQLAWSDAEGRSVVLGRQRIGLGNARFVGNVGFRQNEQTFDALRASFRPFEQTTLTYIYVDRVRRIFGDDSPQGEWDSDSHIVQAEVATPVGRLAAYGLLLDFQDAPAQSSQTYGLRWQNEWELGAYKPRLTLEVAQQREYGGASADFDLGYHHAEFGLRRGPWSVTAGGERLEGDDARGFSTPLATLHAFQGWADVFLATPPDGVRDLYAGASYSATPWSDTQPLTFAVTYHDFADDGGSTAFGSEWDASARFTINEHVSLEAKTALFEGEDARFADRNKFWLALEYRL
jgi:hypothetical protein